MDRDSHWQERSTQQLDAMGRSRETRATDKRPATETPVGRALRTAADQVLSGKSVIDVAALHGLPVDVLRKAVVDLEEGGQSGRTAAAARPRTALRRKLSQEQELELHAVLRGQLPDSLGLHALLWDRDTVNMLIEQRIGAALPQRTLATYLERWGFAPEKPLKSLFKQHPAGMRAWMRRDYPIIAMQARDEGALLAWWGSDHMYAKDRGTSIHGVRPWSNAHLRIMFVVTNRGHLQWLVHHGAPTQELLTVFMERMVAVSTRTLAVIVHDHPLFAAPGFIDWSLRNKDRISFHLLPADLTTAAYPAHDRRSATS